MSDKNDNRKDTGNLHQWALISPVSLWKIHYSVLHMSGKKIKTIYYSCKIWFILKWSFRDWCSLPKGSGSWLWISIAATLVPHWEVELKISVQNNNSHFKRNKTIPSLPCLCNNTAQKINIFCQCVGTLQ